MVRLVSLVSFCFQPTAQVVWVAVASLRFVPCVQTGMWICSCGEGNDLRRAICRWCSKRHPSVICNGDWWVWDTSGGASQPRTIAKRCWLDQHGPHAHSAVLLYLKLEEVIGGTGGTCLAGTPRRFGQICGELDKIENVGFGTLPPGRAEPARLTEDEVAHQTAIIGRLLLTTVLLALGNASPSQPRQHCCCRIADHYLC